MPLWKSLEMCVSKEQIFTLGLADLDKATLEQLYNEAKVSGSSILIPVTFSLVIEVHSGTYLFFVKYYFISNKI